MRGALCVATRLYILYVAADESTSGWEFYCLIPKSPTHETYKYLRILETDTIKQVEMKDKILKKYLRRTRKLLEKNSLAETLSKE